jgi:flagellar hook assembly protein FlgD
MNVRIEVFDVSGRRVQSLMEGPVAPGHHTVVWDGTTTAGGGASSGIYFVRMQAGGRTFLERATLLK